ncbi:hypothetical protein pb186bvf_015854 [Paramecium bursaria]
MGKKQLFLIYVCKVIIIKFLIVLILMNKTIKVIFLKRIKISFFHKNKRMNIIYQFLQSMNRNIFLVNETSKVLINSASIIKVGEIKLPQIRNKGNYFVSVNQIYQLKNLKFSHFKQIDDQFYISNDDILVIKNQSNNKVFADYRNEQFELQIPDMPDDCCFLNKYIVFKIESCLFYCSHKTILEYIISQDYEIYQIVPLNDQKFIGVTFYAQKGLHVFSNDSNNPIKNFDFSFTKHIRFSINIMFSPYIITFFQDDDLLHFILFSNLEYGEPSYYCGSIQIKGIRNIFKFQNKLFIDSKQKLQLIELKDSNIQIEDYVKFNLKYVFHQTNMQDKNIFCSNDHIFVQNGTNTEIFQYLEEMKDLEFREMNVKLNFKIQTYELTDDLIIIYGHSNQFEIRIYNLNFYLIRTLVLEHDKYNMKYCPYYEGLILWQNQKYYIDKNPSNCMLQIQNISNSMIMLVDFQTNIYKLHTDQYVQSYIIQGSISCGFLMDDIIEKIQNISENIFTIQIQFKILIVKITNKPYGLVKLFQFGVLNEKLIMFKNGLPPEDLDRLPILKSQKPEQEIIFSEFKNKIGILQTVQTIKWVYLNIKQNTATLSNIVIKYATIQQVLYWSNDYVYVKVNHEQLIKITPNESQQIYVCDKSIKNAQQYGENILVIKEDNSIVIFNKNKEIVFITGQL